MLGKKNLKFVSASNEKFYTYFKLTSVEFVQVKGSATKKKNHNSDEIIGYLGT